jgi:hypothetical protein
LRAVVDARYIALVRNSRCYLTIAVLIGALLCGAAVGVAHGASTRSCGSVFVTVAGSKAGGRVDALRVPCPRARMVIAYALRHQGEFAVRGPAGWTCARGAAPEFSRVALVCTRRSNRARVRLLRP